MQKAFFTDNNAAVPHNENSLPPITVPERIGSLLLITITITVGVYPQLLLRLILPALNSSLFEGLRSVAAK